MAGRTMTSSAFKPSACGPARCAPGQGQSLRRHSYPHHLRARSTATTNGSAVVVCPAAPTGLAANLEGRQIADWFTARGFRAFILSYRLTSHGYVLPVPLLDARRAIQTVRARARDYLIDPHRIVVIGFSAGGHLAALSATQFVPGNPMRKTQPSASPAGRTTGAGLSVDRRHLVDTSHLSYCKLYNLMDRCETLRAAYSPDLFVTKDTPPTFSFTPSTTRPFRWSRGCASTRRWSRRAYPPRRTSLPTARTAPGWARRCRPRPVAGAAGNLASRAGAAHRGEGSKRRQGSSAFSFNSSEVFQS